MKRGVRRSPAERGGGHIQRTTRRVRALRQERKDRYIITVKSDVHNSQTCTPHAPRSPPSAGKNGSSTASRLTLPTMSVSMSSTLEKLPSSCMKWQSGGWKKRFITAKSRGGQAPWASWPLIRDALRPIGLRGHSDSRSFGDHMLGPCRAPQTLTRKGDVRRVTWPLRT